MLGTDSNTSGHGQANFCPFSYSQDTKMMSFWFLYLSCNNTVSFLLLKMSLPLVSYTLRASRWWPAHRRQTHRFSSSVHKRGKRSRGQWESRVPDACNALLTITGPGPRRVGDGITAPLCWLLPWRQVPTVEEELWSALNAWVSECAQTALFAASLWWISLMNQWTLWKWPQMRML